MKKYQITDFGWHNDIDARYVEYGHSEPAHLHDAIEINFVVSGSGENIVNGQSMRAKRGSMLIMDYNCVHEIRVWKTMKYYTLMFKSSFLNDMTGGNLNLAELLKSRYNYDLKESFIASEIQNEKTVERMCRLFEQTVEEELAMQERYEALIKCHMDEIINLFLRHNKNYEDDEDLLLSEIINYIGDNCSQKLILEDVANRFQCRPKYLSNRLKEYCGESFKSVLINKRLDKAIYYLCRREDTIDEIVEKCGFTNKTFFYEVFEKTYGIKPKFIKEYAANYRNYFSMRSKVKDVME